MMFAGETRNGFENVFIVTKQPGDAGFGPKQQVGFVGQGLLGKLDETAKSFVILCRIPDQSLGNAGLNESHLNGAGGLFGVPELSKPEIKKEGNDQDREKDFRSEERRVGKECRS